MAACGMDASSTGHVYPSSTKAKNVVIRHVTSRDTIKFDIRDLSWHQPDIKTNEEAVQNQKMWRQLVHRIRPKWMDSLFIILILISTSQSSILLKKIKSPSKRIKFLATTLRHLYSFWYANVLLLLSFRMVVSISESSQQLWNFHPTNHWPYFTFLNLSKSSFLYNINISRTLAFFWFMHWTNVGYMLTSTVSRHNFMNIDAVCNV